MKTYIKVQDGKIVSAVGIDDAEKMPSGYIAVDDKYAELLMSGRPLLYKDGEIIVDTAKETENEKTAEVFNEIDALKGNLSATDYVVIKIAEGVATEKEYADVLKDRAEWRKRINELEKEIG